MILTGEHQRTRWGGATSPSIPSSTTSPTWTALGRSVAYTGGSPPARSHCSSHRFVTVTITVVIIIIIMLRTGIVHSSKKLVQDLQIRFRFPSKGFFSLPPQSHRLWNHIQSHYSVNMSIHPYAHWNILAQCLSTCTFYFNFSLLLFFHLVAVHSVRM